ncbi:MAG: DMT family transporter [Bacteroidota bacterium]
MSKSKKPFTDHQSPITNNHTPFTKFWKPLFAVAVWGFSFIATKHALAEIKPLVIILIRQLLGISLLTFLAVKTKKSFAINIHDLGWIVLLALIASFHLWIQVTGLQYTTASNTGWIIGLAPVFMTLLGFFFFKENIGAVQISGIVIAFFGLLLLIGKGNFSSIDFISNKGDFLILASSFTWAVYSLVGKKITLSYSPMMTILFLFVMMSILVAPFTINQANIDAVFHLSLLSWIAILFLGIFCSGIAYVLWAQALNEMSSSKVGAFLYLEPFVTFFSAWLLLNEHITALTLLSGLIIIGGVVLVNRK